MRKWRKRRESSVENKGKGRGRGEREEMEDEMKEGVKKQKRREKGE